MSRTLRCDVCDDELEWDAQVAVINVPHEWVDPSPHIHTTEFLHLDVCTPACLRNLGAILAGETQDVKNPQNEDSEPEDSSPAGETEGVAQIGTAAMPYNPFRPLTPEQSEAVTGVRIKGRG